ncbi:hypothetical protein GCM10022207_53370 [Streptomyces lannensis]|uniref:Transposase n=1 Tax=Streptomyces lannensis TaxID=766498 RepID=A0ABP7KMV9_9ACTN
MFHRLPPLQLGVDERAVHIEQDRLQRGAGNVADKALHQDILFLLTGPGRTRARSWIGCHPTVRHVWGGRADGPTESRGRACPLVPDPAFGRRAYERMDDVFTDGTSGKPEDHPPVHL